MWELQVDLRRFSGTAEVKHLYESINGLTSFWSIDNCEIAWKGEFDNLSDKNYFSTWVCLFQDACK